MKLNFILPDFTSTVRERSAAAVVTTYQASIRALDLNEKEERLFLDIDRLDAFAPRLAKRLKNIKLWRYSPEEREAVKNARRYLGMILTTV